MYIVVKNFSDMQDNNYFYEKGKPFPRDGFDVLPSRIRELSTTANRRGEILIKKVENGAKKIKKSADNPKNE